MRGPATYLQRYLPELLLILVFAGVCWVYDSRLPSHLDIDSHRYLELGQQLLETGRFEHLGVNGELVPDYSRTPTYPLIVAVACSIFGKSGASVAALVWLQRAVWALAVAFLLPPIRRTTGEVRRWTTVSKMVMLFSPVVIVHGALVLTDLLYAAGLLAAVRLMNYGRARGTVAAIGIGIFHGLLTLLRPVHLLIPIVAAVPFFRKHFVLAAVMVVASITLPAAWLVRNYRIHGNVSISALDGRALALHQEHSLRQMRPETSQSKMGPEFIAALHSTNENPITAAWILMRDFGISEIESDGIAKAVALEAIKQRPRAYVLQSLQNVGRLFWSRIDGYNLAHVLWPEAGERVWSFAGILNGIWGLVFFLEIPMLLLTRRVPRKLLISLSGSSVALVALYLIFVPALTTVTYGRFVLPLLPIIGLIYCLADISGGRNRARLWQEKSEKKNFSES